MIFETTLLENVLRSHKRNNVFIETGTNRGGACKLAVHVGFDKVYSVEIDKEAYDFCRDVLSEEIKTNKVELVYGDSFTFLKNLLPQITEPVTFWLDAHLDNIPSNIPLPNGVISPSPLISELELIKELSPGFNHTIMIDDIRIFDAAVGWGSYNPVNRFQIQSKILEINPKYKFSYEPNTVKNGDVLVAYI